MSRGNCATHRRRTAVTVCVGCGRGLCADCMVRTHIGIKCRACTRPASRRRRSVPRGAVAAAAGVALLVGAAGLLPNRERFAELGGPASEPAAPRITHVDVAFRGSGDLLIRGTLDLPAGATHGSHGVVIVPGFGPTTRDGVAPEGVVTDPFYRDLGEALAGAGFAVLRYDKRGSGQSAPLPEGQELSWDDLVADSAAAVDHLRDRPEVRSDDVALIGHDEGGLVGMRVSGDDSGIAALVLIATPGRPLAEILEGEIRRGALMSGRRSSRRLAEELEAAVTTLLATGKVPEVSDELEAVFPPDQDAYLKEVFSLEPRREARAVQAPVLIVRGGRDPGIRSADVRSLRRALVDADVDLLIAPEAGHTLQIVSETGGGDDDHGGASGGGPPQRDMEALRAFVRWLQRSLG